MILKKRQIGEQYSRNYKVVLNSMQCLPFNHNDWIAFYLLILIFLIYSISTNFFFTRVSDYFFFTNTVKAY